MKFRAAKIFWVVLLAALFLMPSGVGSQEQPPTPPPTPVKPQQPPEAPDLAELVLRANELSKRLVVLETKIDHGLDLSAFENRLAKIEARLEKYPSIIQELKAYPILNYEELLSYKDSIRLNAKSLEALVDPVSKAVSNLAAAREQWLAERKRWQEWKTVLPADETLDEVKTTFNRAQNTIDAALQSINQELQPLLEFLKKSGQIDTRVSRFLAEIDVLISARRKAFQPSETAPMFSWTYFSQLQRLTNLEMERGVRAISWPKPEFYQTQGWIIALQILTALVVTLLILRHRSRLQATERWRFLAERPVATGLLLGIFPLFLLMSVLPSFIYLVYVAVGGLAAVRLLGGLVNEFWKKLLLYALVFFAILINFFSIINLPQPFIRLYIFVSALVGLGLFSWRGVVSAREGSTLNAWLFRLGGVFFLIVLVAELMGYAFFAERLLRSSLQTAGWILLGWLLIYLSGGGVEALVQSATLKKVSLVREHSQSFIRQLGVFVKVLIGGVTLALILMAWNVYDNPWPAIKGILSWGITIGSYHITAGLVILAVAFLYASFLLSWIIQSLLLGDETNTQKMGAGGQQSLARLIHYALVFVGFLLALVVLGIDLTKVTILLGALGVGIGFGLQQIVNNLVCGIILLVERPIRVGDYIQLSSGDWAEVKGIGLRATRVLTFDRADIMIPNGDLITREVINWTFSDRFARLKLPVGVAYGSSTEQVLNILMEVANEDKAVVRFPAPYAFFNGFGDSALNFELRVYLLDLDNWFTVYGRLYQDIERKLREAGITIPFPQRDLHLRSVDPSVLDRGSLPEVLMPQAASNPSQEKPEE